MAKNIVPIKVKIGLRPSGHADHPAWDTLPLAQTSIPEETIKSHVHCSWRYDKTCGHQEDSVDSPFGMQWGMMLVSLQFANEAVTAFPGIVSIMTELECQDFWDNKAHAHVPENRIDEKALNALNTELQLKKAIGQSTTALEVKIARALDPNDKERGLRDNKDKTWAKAKVNMGVSVVV